MLNREKVIKAVECRKNVHKRCGNPCEQIGDCEYAVWARDSHSEPYYPYCCDIERLCDDILLLLKEQEPVEPLIDVDTYVCSNCGHRLEHQSMIGDNVIFDEQYNFCPACGKAVKWG